MARDTRISLHHLESLEEGRYSELPGGMYNRAFLRSYCDYLGIDSGEGLARYEVENPPTGDKPVKVKPKIPQTSTSLKPHPLLVWSVMLLISVAGCVSDGEKIAARLPSGGISNVPCSISRSGRLDHARGVSARNADP